MRPRIVLSLWVCTGAHAATLLSPWDGLKIALTDQAYVCPAPPAFDKTLEIGSYYIDSHASVIDPKKLAAFNEKAEGPTHLGQYAGRAADAYLTTGSRAAAR